jgi:hypothetical protein
MMVAGEPGTIDTIPFSSTHDDGGTVMGGVVTSTCSIVLFPPRRNHSHGAMSPLIRSILLYPFMFQLR